jgi:HK97 family phage prohead protease
MQTRDVYEARAELKFLDGEPEGTIGGLGAVFGNTDSHEDVIMPGACLDSLAEHRARGTLPKMFLNHSAFTGGSPLAVGVWSEMAETADGLRVKGRLFDVAHPEIALLKANLVARQIDGLSIAFSVPEGGATFSKKAGEPRRRLHKLNLVAVDIVGDPSNDRARIDMVKSSLKSAATDTACAALALAGDLHSSAMGCGNGAVIDHSKQMMNHIQTAHVALTGQAIALKCGFYTIREFEAWLRRHPEDGGLGYSNAKAREIGNLVFKTAQEPRDEGQAEAATKEAIAEIGGFLKDFSLPSF